MKIISLKKIFEEFWMADLVQLKADINVRH